MLYEVITKEIVDMILHRDPSRLSASSLEATFKEGGAVARDMVV